MAKKSVKEILAAARKGGPAPAGPAEPAPTASTVAPGEATPAARAPGNAVTPPPASGRPLSMKEKLAAARGGAAPAASVSAAPESPAPQAPEAPSPASLSRPLTVQEKMAAARAKSGAASSTAARPAGAKAATAGSAAATTRRVLPPISELSDPKDLAEALRQTAAKKAAEVTAAAKTAEPARPAREKETRPASVLPRPTRAVLGSPDRGQLRRRLFLVSGLSILWVGWGAFATGVLAFTAMLGRFMFPNVLAEPPSTIKVGVPQNYDPESVNERFKAEWGFWVVRSRRYNGEDILYALQSVCTHLGCPPNWLEGEQKFKCPCHGSGYYISGINFEGPAPRPLERFKVTLADDGQIVVDKSQKFQQEQQQWNDADSFIPVV